MIFLRSTKNTFQWLLMLFCLVSCHNKNAHFNSSNDDSTNTEKTATSTNANDNIPSEIVGSFKGYEAAYNLKNSNGNEMIINGSTVSVPASELLFTISNEGTVQLIQESGAEKIVYNGSLKIIENT